MRRRILFLLSCGMLAGSLALAQMPPPPPSPSPAPSPTPIPTWPPPPSGYGCTDDAGNWYPDGGTRSEESHPDLQGGSQTVTETYRCFHGEWALQLRVTNWSSTTGDVAGPNGQDQDGGNRTEWYDYTTGCQTFMTEYHNTVHSWTTAWGSVAETAHCYLTQKGQSCQSPNSTYDQKVDRWYTRLFSKTIWSFEEAGYEDTSNSVGYDPTGKLVQDSHTHYKRLKVIKPLAFPVGTVTGTFSVISTEQGATLPHPMWFRADYLLAGGGAGENLWSGQAQIPQYDAFGTFTGYASATIGEILSMARGREFLPGCGADDGNWVWNPPEPPPWPFF